MRRGGHPQAVLPVAVIPQAASIAPHRDVPSQAARATGPALIASTVAAETEVLLSPAGTFHTPAAAELASRSERQRQLGLAIRQRIESRLAGRVRDLIVRVDGETVILEGACSTYYTKQLAQHIALALLENEQLENAIAVRVPR